MKLFKPRKYTVLFSKFNMIINNTLLIFSGILDMPKVNSLSEITIVLKTLCVNDFFTKLTKAG